MNFVMKLDVLILKQFVKIEKFINLKFQLICAFYMSMSLFPELMVLDFMSFLGLKDFVYEGE